MKLWVSLMCRNIDAQLEFYREVLGLPEALVSRSPIYRALETPDFQLGFSAWDAYALLGLGARAPDDDHTPPPVTSFPTLMLGECSEVDTAVQQARELSATVLKAPYPTYYGQWQAVLAGPEGNVFRLAAATLPTGIVRPALTIALHPFSESL